VYVLHSYIVTCGSDGDVRMWEDLDDDDPKSVNVGEKAFSCALKVLISVAVKK
jgi:chromosome transmission fidelity protein 4